MQRVKVGDLVQVIAGKEKGKRGAVKRILKGGERVIVDGLNVVVRHTRPTQQGGEGGRISKEASIHISNVMPINSATDKPTRVKVAKDEAGKVARDNAGNKVRVSASKGAALKQA
ncbi:MAG: 50S ribosomal protein L24 [Alphaproteobacteria bacterium]|nr:50S ribosomal protein L24 [Alphaproteobacteria bacterium]